MMPFIYTIASLHLIAYLGIMWYGWQIYKLLRKPSWKVMGVGFGVLLAYRVRQLVRQLAVDYPIDTEATVMPFVGAVLLLVAFWMMSREHVELIHKLSEPPQMRAGAQSVDYWMHVAREQAAKTLEDLRVIVREEIAAASGTTTVTVKGPAAVLTEPTMETPPPK